MQAVYMKSQPEILSAHTFTSAQYSSFLRAAPGYIEITYVKKGSLRCQRGDTEFTVSENEILCNTNREDLTLTSDSFHEQHSVCFRCDFETGQNDENHVIYLPEYISSQHNTENIRSLIDKIIEAHTLSPHNKMMSCGLFCILLGEIDRLTGSTGQDAGPEPIHIAKAKKYIYLHLQEPIMQKDVAAYLHVSPQYLCSLFKEHCRTSLMMYVNRMKLDKIKYTMEKENLKLYEAAAMYGYSDPNYVSRLYKKIYHKNITDS